MFAFGTETMPVGDEDFTGTQERAKSRRNDVERFVIVADGVGAQNLQTFLDGQVRAADEDGAREPQIGGLLAPVTERPCDEHRHDDGLTASGRHFAPVAQEGQGILAGGGIQKGRKLVVEKPGIELWAVACAVRAFIAHFGKEDDGFDGFELAEEETAIAVFAVPVFKKVFGDLLCAAIAGFAPAFHILAEGFNKGKVTLSFVQSEQGLPCLLRCFVATKFVVIAGGASSGLHLRHAAIPVIVPVGGRLAVGTV